MKKTVWMILALSLLLCACSRGETVTPTAEPETPAPTAEALEEAEEVEEIEEIDESEEQLAVLIFSTTDREGNSWDESCFASHSITMINFFEPWCGPCVNELPELQKLSENYADRGFQILGVYETEEDMDNVLAQTGVTYPILHYTEEMYPFTSQYVPTSVFFNEKGECLGQVIGACEYEDWESILLQLYGE